MNKVALIAHKSFEENLVLAVPDFKASGLEEIGYREVGSADLTKRQFQDRGSIHDYGLSGGLSLPLERIGFKRITGKGDVYLITQSWRTPDKKTSKSYAYVVNPETGNLVYQQRKFILNKSGEEPMEVRGHLGYGSYRTKTKRILAKIGELSETRNLAKSGKTDPKLFWLEEWLIKWILEEKKRISYIDFDPDDGACLG